MAFSSNKKKTKKPSTPLCWEVEPTSKKTSHLHQKDFIIEINRMKIIRKSPSSRRKKRRKSPSNWKRRKRGLLNKPKRRRRSDCPRRISFRKSRKSLFSTNRIIRRRKPWSWKSTRTLTTLWPIKHKKRKKSKTSRNSRFGRLSRSCSPLAFRSRTKKPTWWCSPLKTKNTFGTKRKPKRSQWMQDHKVFF